MIPDENDGRGQWVFDLGPLEINIEIYKVYREPGLGIQVPIGGPGYFQLFGITIQLLIIMICLEVYKYPQDTFSSSAAVCYEPVGEDESPVVFGDGWTEVKFSDGESWRNNG